MKEYSEPSITWSVQVTQPNDIIFKSVFGRDTNTHILMPLLNSVPGFTDRERIEKAEILNPFRSPI
ncbi:MAG: PD-(D/E)XK nuclease family transposase [Vulcanimicrobiota bacterium]